ncbi:L,D-transpeptidase family protein [Methylocystis sp. IM3]|uniref:L,D-transpeptidase family protein n=1 Tax=unclassified Methylocystis TaxID=2625913 RepID=UPI0030F8AE3E
MRTESCAAAFRLAAAAIFSLHLSPVFAERAEASPPEARETEKPSRALPSYGPETERATLEAARRYADIAALGGWPHIRRPLGPDSHGTPVAELRRRLAIEGYLPQDQARDEDPRWDDDLTDAVRRFQAHVGLEQTGEVSRETLLQLNVSPAARARALAATAGRLSRMRFRFPERYVAVNLPAAAVEAVEDDETQARYDAIVGGKRHPSPQITARIDSVDINPTWTVPASIIRKELAPRLKRNPNYLAHEHIRIFDGRGHAVDPRRLRRLSAARAAHFTFRQDPGPNNALGSLRLSMPNKDAVYMHDTPRKDLFDRDYRFLSHGCVRVEGVYDLAAWLLNDGAHKWDEAGLRDEVEEGRTEKIRLDHPTTVAWVYMTGWATDDGPAQFRRDIYSLDKGAKPPPHGRAVALR